VAGIRPFYFLATSGAAHNCNHSDIKNKLL
jgi:hypothetical protein